MKGDDSLLGSPGLLTVPSNSQVEKMRSSGLFFSPHQEWKAIFLFLIEKIKRIVIVKNERRQTWRERGYLAPGLTAQHGPCEFHGP